jgi:hypothetical protein
MYSMPFRCKLLPDDVVSGLNAKILTLPAAHPFRKEYDAGDIDLVFDAGVSLFHYHGNKGFYFYRCDPFEALRRVIVARDNCICIAFKLTGEVEEKMRSRFQEQYGRAAETIDTLVTSFNGEKIMLAKFPTAVVRMMMAPSGGVLKTWIRGPRTALAEISAVAPHLPDDDGSPDVKCCIVSEYGDGGYWTAKEYHNAVVRAVVANNGRGITLGPIAVWDAA